MSFSDSDLIVKYHIQWPLADKITESNVWIAGTLAEAGGCAQGFPYYVVNSINYTCIEHTQQWVSTEPAHEKCIGMQEIMLQFWQ